MAALVARAATGLRADPVAPGPPALAGLRAAPGPLRGVFQLVLAAGILAAYRRPRGALGLVGRRRLQTKVTVVGALGEAVYFGYWAADTGEVLVGVATAPPGMRAAAHYVTAGVLRRVLVASPCVTAFARSVMPGYGGGLVGSDTRECIVRSLAGCTYWVGFWYLLVYQWWNSGAAVSRNSEVATYLMGYVCLRHWIS